MNVGLSKFYLSFVSSAKSSSSDDMLRHIFPATFSDLHSSHATAERIPCPQTSISNYWPSVIESMEMRKVRISKLINCIKEKFENKCRFPISSGQLQIREGVFSGWEHCHIQKGVLEPREGGGQSPKLWVGGGQES